MLRPKRAMQPVLTTALALVALLALLVKGPYRGAWLFFATTPLGAAAAVNLPAAGGASILVADVMALALFFLVLASAQGPSRVLGSMRFGQPGFWLLLLTVAGTFATLLLPTVFRGQTDVFSIARSANQSGIVSVPLAPSTGNLTQLFRLFLGVAVFFALATVFRLRPNPQRVIVAVAIATGLNAALGWLDVLTYALGRADLMAPLRSANYAILFDVRMVGLKRMIGGYPEASSFGYFSLGLMGFWVQYWVAAPRSRLAVIMLALTTVAVLRSTSSAAYVAVFVFLVTFGLLSVLAHLRSRVNRRGAGLAASGLVVLWMSAVVLFAAYELNTTVEAFLDRALFNKLEGASGTERLSWNAQALRNVYDTWGLGAGLGSVRASNWLIATLASLGVLGTALYGVFIVTVLAGREGRFGADPRSVTLRSLRAGCLAFLISAMLTAATPDLGLTFFAFAGAAAGLARGAILLRSGRLPPQAGLL